MRILAIDPGLDTGWSWWQDGLLGWAGLGGDVDNLTDAIVMEIPQIYPGGPTVDPNAIIKLAITAGRYLEHQQSSLQKPAAYGVYPRTWKGQLDKASHHKQFRAQLSEQNTRRLEHVGLEHVPKSKQHNVLDALALGWWASKQVEIGARLGRADHHTLREVCDYVFPEIP